MIRRCRRIAQSISIALVIVTVIVMIREQVRWMRLRWKEQKGFGKGVGSHPRGC